MIILIFLSKFDKILIMLVATKEIIQKITKEISMLPHLEQQILLTRLRVKRLNKKGIGIIANPPKNLKTPTLKQIDKWKHDSRIPS